MIDHEVREIYMILQTVLFFMILWLIEIFWKTIHIWANWFWSHHFYDVLFYIEVEVISPEETPQKEVINGLTTCMRESEYRVFALYTYSEVK